MRLVRAYYPRSGRAEQAAWQFSSVALTSYPSSGAKIHAIHDSLPTMPPPSPHNDNPTAQGSRQADEADEADKQGKRVFIPPEHRVFLVVNNGRYRPAWPSSTTSTYSFQPDRTLMHRKGSCGWRPSRGEQWSMDHMATSLLLNHSWISANNCNLLTQCQPS